MEDKHTDKDVNDSDDAMASFDPMGVDFRTDIGLRRDDFPKELGISLPNSKRIKDVPCQFHDGFSGTCWKGKKCLYGHEMLTGGEFVAKYPELAVAETSRREVTTVISLPPKPLFKRNAFIKCEVVHVVSPSEFYIRPTNGCNCICKSVNKAVNDEREKKKQEEKVKLQAKLPGTSMDSYYYGFNSMEEPEGLKESEGPPTTQLFSGASLQRFLQHALNYRNFQHDFYFPKVELVAVRINSEWMRALVLRCDFESGATDQNVRVQLIDTGEKLYVHAKQVCSLPERFSNCHAKAFKCCLFGISPVWYVWCNAATEKFKELVTKNHIVVEVKDVVRREIHGDFKVLEPRPYFVQIVVKHGEKDIDVAEKLAALGYGLKWRRSTTF